MLRVLLRTCTFIYIKLREEKDDKMNQETPNDAAVLDPIDALYDELNDLEEHKRMLDVQITHLRARILSELQDREERKFRAASGATISLAQRDSVAYDHQRLESILGRKYLKVSRRVLDTGLLEAAVRSGEIAFDDVEACIQVTPGKPYLQIRKQSNGE